MHRDPHLVQLVQHGPQRPDGALQHAGVGHVEDVAILLQHLTAFARFLAALLAQVHVGPAGEAVFLVPRAFAVAHDDELLHRLIRLSAGEHGGRAQALFDAQQLVVLGDAIGAAGRAGLDLARVGGHREVRDERIFGLAGAVD